jgi:hypothetical protein
MSRRVDIIHPTPADERARPDAGRRGGRTFAMADPDGYRITVYERDQPLFWPPKA